MVDYLPKEIINRQKQGFLLPVINWLNNDLKDFSKEILLDNNTYISRLFSQSYLESLC